LGVLRGRGMFQVNLTVTGVCRRSGQVTVRSDCKPISGASQRTRKRQSGGAVTIENKNPGQGFVFPFSPQTR
jgi:hypothetical protein